MVTLCVPLAANAQQWQLNTGDDGAWFGASATPGDYAYSNQTIELYCGGPSRQAKPLTAEHNHAVETASGMIRLSLGPAAVGRNAVTDGPVAGIQLLVDGAAFPHPPFEADMLNGGHETMIAMGDPLVTALKSGSSASVTVAGTPVRAIALRGSSRAIGGAIDYCAVQSGAVAVPAAAAPAGAAAGPTASSGDDDDAVKRLQAAIAEELLVDCRAQGGKSVTFEKGAVNIDSASGSPPDVIFNFHHILCNGASYELATVGVGYCGAGPCLQRRFSYADGRYTESDSYYQ